MYRIIWIALIIIAPLVAQEVVEPPTWQEPVIISEEYTAAEIQEKIKRYRKLRTGGIVMLCTGLPTLTGGIVLLATVDDPDTPFFARLFGGGSSGDVITGWAGLLGTGWGVAMTAAGGVLTRVGSVKVRQYEATIEAALFLAPKGVHLKLAYRF